MKKLAFVILWLMTGVVAIFLFFSRLNTAMEIDDLKEQIKLQNKEMHFLEDITNGILDSNGLSVENFEAIIRKSGRDVIWQGNDALVGAFKIQKKDDYIIAIHAIEGL